MKVKFITSIERSYIKTAMKEDQWCITTGISFRDYYKHFKDTSAYGCGLFNHTIHTIKMRSKWEFFVIVMVYAFSVMVAANIAEILLG